MKQKGFTIVELLIVIVVIAILAAIVIVAYNGVQNRAYDNRRLVDMNNIQKALEIYKIQNGDYPAPTSANEDSTGWETSYVTGKFLAPLITSGAVSAVPVDPINNSTYFYQYYRYNAGQYGCDASRGDYYVLRIRAFQGQSSDKGPGFKCTNRDWSTEAAAWITGGYVN